MKTNVKLPLFVQKFLNIYSIVTVSLGFIIIVLLNSNSLYSVTKDIYAYPNGPGEILNICGAGCPAVESDWDTRAGDCGYDSQYRCNRYACNGRKNSVPGDITDCYLSVYRCEEGEEGWIGDCGLCNENLDPYFYDYINYSDVFNVDIDPFHHSGLPTDCLMIQIDLFCGYGSDWRTYDWVVWKGNRFGSPECKPAPPPLQGCYYNGNPVRAVISSDPSTASWEDLTSDSDSALVWTNDNIYIGGIASDGVYMIGQHIDGNEDDGVITINGPDGYSVSGSCNSSGITNTNFDCIMGPISTAGLSAGLYTINLTVDENYNDPDCIDIGFFRIVEIPSPPPPEQDFEIQKILLDPQNEYISRDTVRFGVSITNTGETIIDQMLFLDRYDSRYLEFVSMTGRHEQSGREVDFTDILTIKEIWNNLFEIQIDNLAQYLGNLEPNESYRLELTFNIKSLAASVTTCNLAIADDGNNRKADQVCLNIVLVTVPPTDK